MKVEAVIHFTGTVLLKKLYHCSARQRKQSCR